MSAESSSRSAPEDLQFDRAVDPDSSTTTGSPVCAKCSAAIRMYYYDVDGETTCSSCKQAAERASGGGPRSGGMMKALLFGVGAAVAGAVIYYSVMKYLELEIGYVAILIGFMVGYAVRAAVAGRGGRRFQVLAAALTYFAVALAYLPFSIEGMREAAQEEAAADSVALANGDATDATSVDATASDDAAGDAADQTVALDADAGDDGATAGAASSLGVAGVAIGLGGGLLFVLLLPIVVILGSMPSGLISALIIAIGMHQAWSMTRAIQLSISGPFKVGAERSTAAA